jgi:hypothetical protein
VTTFRPPRKRQANLSRASIVIQARTDRGRSKAKAFFWGLVVGGVVVTAIAFLILARLH